MRACAALYRLVESAAEASTTARCPITCRRYPGPATSHPAPVIMSPNCAYHPSSGSPPPNQGSARFTAFVRSCHSSKRPLGPVGLHPVDDEHGPGSCADAGITGASVSRIDTDSTDARVDIGLLLPCSA